MKAIRPLTFLTGVALLGLGGALLARSRKRSAEPNEERNAEACVPYGTGRHIEKVFTIDRPAAELYAAWRDLESLPTIMSHLRAVEIIDARRSRWHAHGPAGTRASWEAEIVDDTPGRRIAWRSVGGGPANAGSVTFAPTMNDRTTELRLEMECAPPAGPVGAFALLFRRGDPGSIIESDLRRFKSIMESGGPPEGLDVST
jgi:uncharacterized membrane protein